MNYQRKVWTSEEETRLKEMYEAASKEELMATFNTTWTRIKGKASKLGGVNRQKCKIDEAALINDYKSGMPVAQIWEKYDLSNPTLRGILAKHNVPSRNNNLDNINVEEFTTDYQELNMPELVNKYKVSRPTIIRKANDLKLNRPKVFLLKQCSLRKLEAEICQKYTNESKSMEVLAREYNVSVTNIHLLLHNNNVKIKEGIYGAAENEVRTFVETVTKLKFNKDKTILGGKEIDLYNHELKLGIEYCGLYWHNESRPNRGVDYHYDKYKLAKDQGIQLITIFEDEWLNRNEQVKGALLSILHKNPRKIHGRKCEVRLIESGLGKQFYNDYHIQGAANLSKHFAGLYFKDELVGVLSFGLHHRNTTQHTLDRLCFKSGVTVMGGSDKLFRFLIKETGITKLISWSDNRWFFGNVYPKLGFIKEGELKPDYSYVNINELCERVSKQSQKKGNTNCPVNLTEKQWCAQRNLFRIWDCGKIRWVWEAGAVNSLANKPTIK